MSNELTMTEDQAKIYVSKRIIPQVYGSDQGVLRELIFSMAIEINWEDISKTILREHPELRQKDIDDLVSK